MMAPLLLLLLPPAMVMAPLLLLPVMVMAPLLLLPLMVLAPLLCCCCYPRCSWRPCYCCSNPRW
jgi:hypothetical protein